MTELHAADPIVQFQTWFNEARASGHLQPDAFALSTSSINSRPSVRFLLLKEVRERHFHFFTNYESNKVKDLSENPQAEMAFFWEKLFRQVRVYGKVTRLTGEESDAYWRTRPRESQIGGWSSPQSRKIQSREELDKLVESFATKFKDQPIPRPPHWGGFKLAAERIEFWTGRKARLHDREVYLWNEKSRGWEYGLLAP